MKFSYLLIIVMVFQIVLAGAIFFRCLRLRKIEKRLKLVEKRFQTKESQNPIFQNGKSNFYIREDHQDQAPPQHGVNQKI
jgi:biopolymer transport protein ExbB/TolQ